MATTNTQRVAAFLLAGLFLLTTLGGTAYVVWEINRETILPSDSQTASTESETQDPEEAACGEGEFAAVEPRALPTVTKLDGAVTELRKTDVKEGTGEEVQAGDCVAALYYGTLASSGEKFDGNYETGTPIEFSLSGVIAGWAEGIPGMKVGGVRRLEIPATLGYGEEGSGQTIPPNSDLIFEVEIISTKRGV